MLLKQTTNLQCPGHFQSALQLSPSSGAPGGGNNSNNPTTKNQLEQRNGNKQAYRELWIRCTEVSLELVDWIPSAGGTMRSGGQLQP
jgi:hypothetical protein